MLCCAVDFLSRSRFRRRQSLSVAFFFRAPGTNDGVRIFWVWYDDTTRSRIKFLQSQETKRSNTPCLLLYDTMKSKINNKTIMLCCYPFGPPVCFVTSSCLIFLRLVPTFLNLFTQVRPIFLTSHAVSLLILQLTPSITLFVTHNSYGTKRLDT